MARFPTPPTKSNLLRLRRELETVREGYDLLDQKRKILVLEMMGMVESAKRVQQEVQEKMAAAFKALRIALLREGALQLGRDAAGARAEPTAEVATRSLMGIYLPSLVAEHPEPEPLGSLFGGSAALDDAGRAFADALKAIDRLAEVETCVLRLAREVRKTQRRVNALDKLFIPAYSETVKFITDALDEQERDQFVVMRMLKERAEKHAAPGEML